MPSGVVAVIGTIVSPDTSGGAIGEFIRQLGALGSANGEFNSPRGVAVNQTSGNLYVADAGNNRIQEFDSNGEFIRKWGSEGTGNGQFNALQGIAIDAEGHVWALEGGSILGSDRVQEFSSEGVYISQFGKEGTEAGQLKHAEGIAVDSAGNVWVADTENNRVQEFKPSGEWVRAWGAAGSGAGQLSAPRGLAFDAEGDLWVTDTGNDRVEAFAPAGAYLVQFGIPGNNNGQFAEPRAVAVGSAGSLLIADAGNDRAQQWGG
jgi:tripartite motif-containing protein 71